MRVDREHIFLALWYIYFACLILLLPLHWLLGWGIAVLIHEAGHWVGVILCGGEITSVSVCFGGLDMQTVPMSRGKMVFCTLFGPVCGVLPTFLCRWFPQLAVCSFLLTVYNLLPVCPLDGGRILELALHRNGRLIRGIERCVIMIGFCFGVLFCLWCNIGGIVLIVMVQLWMKNRKFTCKRGSDKVQ